MQVHQAVKTQKWGRASESAVRDVPEETAVAMVINGSTHAVMMATPADLQDFAFGFALTERLVATLADIERFEILEHENGLEARLWLSEPQARMVASRRRAMAGPTGCGLCGIESLDEAMRASIPVSAFISMTQSEVLYAMSQLRPAQTLNALTHAVHAAALWNADIGTLIVREDVGRHNALDKLIGAVARTERPVHRSVLLLTSRVSIEMVQKAAVLGVGIIVAVSAPTNLAVQTAEASGITLCAVARADGFEVFSHHERIVSDHAEL